MDKQQTKLYHSKFTGHCPVSGLPILQKPEWTNVKLGKNCRTTVRMLGNRILQVKAVGYSDLQVMKKAMLIEREVLAECKGATFSFCIPV